MNNNLIFSAADYQDDGIAVNLDQLQLDVQSALDREQTQTSRFLPANASSDMSALSELATLALAKFSIPAAIGFATFQFAQAGKTSSFLSGPTSDKQTPSSPPARAASARSLFIGETQRNVNVAAPMPISHFPKIYSDKLRESKAGTNAAVSSDLLTRSKIAAMSLTGVSNGNKQDAFKLKGLKLEQSSADLPNAKAMLSMSLDNVKTARKTGPSLVVLEDGLNKGQSNYLAWADANGSLEKVKTVQKKIRPQQNNAA